MCGGIVLFYAGWTALNAPADSAEEESVATKKPMTFERAMSMAFYPLTLPLTMGPGVISVATAMGAGIFEGGLMAFAGLMTACLA
ncbi:multiple antibiotic resistance (MarC)-related protein, partial [gut metagenome]